MDSFGRRGDRGELPREREGLGSDIELTADPLSRLTGTSENRNECSARTCRRRFSYLTSSSRSSPENCSQSISVLFESV